MSKKSQAFKTETEEKFNCVNAENKMLTYNDRLICKGARRGGARGGTCPPPEIHRYGPPPKDNLTRN